MEFFPAFPFIRCDRDGGQNVLKVVEVSDFTGEPLSPDRTQLVYRLALAAPALLEALKAAINRIESIKETSPEYHVDDDLRIYRAAVAKAEGRAL